MAKKKSQKKNQKDSRSAAHKSHKMGEPEAKMLAPAGTLRFYAVRTCKNCGAQEASHPAGYFCDPELRVQCVPKDKPKNKKRGK